jgi:hypothetical protein
MSPIPLYRVMSGPGALTIGTIVRTIMFHRSLTLNGMTGWTLSSRKVPSSSPPPELKLNCQGMVGIEEIGFCCSLARADASAGGAGGV